jgi:hypothetical protein
MSTEKLRNEIDTLILQSGRKAHTKMRCSILRALKLRHGDLDNATTLNAIDNAIEALS